MYKGIRYHKANDPEKYKKHIVKNAREREQMHTSAENYRSNFDKIDWNKK